MCVAAADWVTQPPVLNIHAELLSATAPRLCGYLGCAFGGDRVAVQRHYEVTHVDVAAERQQLQRAVRELQVALFREERVSVGLTRCFFLQFDLFTLLDVCR